MFQNFQLAHADKLALRHSLSQSCMNAGQPAYLQNIALETLTDDSALYCTKNDSALQCTKNNSALCCAKNISACMQVVRADKLALRHSLSQSLQVRHSAMMKGTRSLRQKLSLITVGSVSQHSSPQSWDSSLDMLSMSAALPKFPVVQLYL